MEYVAFFAPRDFFNATPLYSDYLTLLNYNGQVYTDYVYLNGMWPLSYVPSTDWARGLRRLLHHIGTFKTSNGNNGTRHWLGQVTSPHFFNIEKRVFDPGWQTASRAHQYNNILRQVALEFNANMIDTYSLTVPLYERRTDNCHFCDSVALDLAIVVMNGICRSDDSVDGVTASVKSL